MASSAQPQEPESEPPTAEQLPSEGATEQTPSDTTPTEQETEQPPEGTTEPEMETAPPAENTTQEAAQNTTPTPTPQPSTQATTEPVQAPAETTDPEKAFRDSLLQYNYVGSSEQKIYHKPTCRYVNQINAGNLVHFDTVEEAIADKRDACKVCGPG